jgi:DNA (cytosine-5)-methyltransferase 1
MKFIDLFAGLGGFHLALRKLGHECVFACELDDSLRQSYLKNFGIMPEGDIRVVKIDDIPDHEILCAGFPCQPFSKAGEQEGFGCPKWGDLFDYVLSVLEHHRPSYALLENVPNLLYHNNGKTWKYILLKLDSLSYHIDYKKLSPHKFGIPQIRERIFIVASQSPLNGFSWPIPPIRSEPHITSILDEHPKNAKPITLTVQMCLDTWQNFLDLFPKNEPLPSFPIWAMEFGATYPYQKTTPYSIGKYRLCHFKGSFGQSLDKMEPSKRLMSLPPYARVKEHSFPAWKVEFITKNRNLFEKHKKWIKLWLPEIRKFPASLQKLEWNCGSEPRNVYNYVIQFRASGVRIKRPSTSPSLIAMTTTQVPIIAWEKRYMTVHECARLQSMDSLKYFPSSETSTYKALGNAVNVNMVEMIAKNLLSSSDRKIISQLESKAI